MAGLFDFGSKSKFPKLEALSGKTVTTDDASAANEELRAAGITTAALITQENYTALVQKGKDAEASAKQVTDLTATNTDLQGKLNAAQAEVTRLGALGGADPTTAAKKEGDAQEAPKAASYFDPNAEHNQEAASLLGI